LIDKQLPEMLFFQTLIKTANFNQKNLNTTKNALESFFCRLIWVFLATSLQKLQAKKDPACFCHH
jgi:hypothetical protein